MESPIEHYLYTLRRRLRRYPVVADRAAEVVSDRLRKEAADARDEGMSVLEAEQEAVRRMGPIDRFVRELIPRLSFAQILFVLAVAASSMAAMWLGYVIATVVPLRDPQHAALWGSLEFGLICYIGLSTLYLRRRGSGRILTGAFLLASVAAIVAGWYGIIRMLEAVRSGHGFEGYVIALGAILIVHGGSAILYARSVRGPRGDASPPPGA